MWIKWFLILALAVMLFLIVFGFVKQTPIKQKLDLLLNIVWYPIGIFSLVSFIAVWFDVDLYRELGADMQYSSDKWVLLISGALFVRSGMHVISTWVVNLKYYSTMETLAMFLMALGVFNLGTVKLNAGSVSKTIESISSSMPSAPATSKPLPSYKKPSFGGNAKVVVAKAKVYKDSKGQVKAGYLLKDQNVKFLMVDGGYSQVDYSGKLYWIQSNHIKQY